MRQSEETGRMAEEAACRYLRGKGYDIKERRFRCRGGEIDVIARSPDGFLCFIEVKYRKGVRSGYPLESVDLRKRRRIVLAGRVYLMKNQLADIPSRFDVVELWKNEAGEGKVRHHENCFDLGDI